MVASAVDDAATANPPRREGLALLLADGTRKSHSVLENSAFVIAFFRGLATTDSYAQLLCGLYHVYDAMEEALDASSCAAVRALDFPELRRRESLEADMAFFFGAEWRDARDARPSTAAVAYAAHIRKVAAGPAPELLIGHVYSRCIGDLMIASLASKSLQLKRDAEDGDGLAFYEFKQIDDTKSFISRWYSKLNELDLSAVQKEAIVQEANVVFGLHTALSNEIEGYAASDAFAVAESETSWLRAHFDSAMAWAREPHGLPDSAIAWLREPHGLPPAAVGALVAATAVPPVAVAAAATASDPPTVAVAIATTAAAGVAAAAAAAVDAAP